MKKIALALFAVVLGLSCARAAESSLVLRVSTPLVFSAAAGLKFGEGEGFHPVIQGEAGAGGGKIAVGLDSSGDGRFGLALKAAFLRTWIEPVEVDEDQSFLGLEGELSIQRMVLNLGGYRRVSDGDDDWLMSAGLGFRF
jgi:hypothetical protein